MCIYFIELHMQILHVIYIFLHVNSTVMKLFNEACSEPAVPIINFFKTLNNLRDMEKHNTYKVLTSV